MDKMETDAGSLLKSGWFSDWTYSATARMSVGESRSEWVLRVMKLEKSIKTDFLIRQSYIRMFT